MTPLPQIVEHVTSLYRWGLHPLKMLVALSLPVLVLWLGDRRVRALAAVVEEEEARRRRLPRIRRRRA